MVIDIGCGKRKQEPNAIGLDLSSDSAADALCNLNQLPWPVRDNTATKIYFSHVIEHLEDVMGAMREIHRIARPGARVHIVTPHFSSHNSYADPTHRRHLTSESFQYFTGEPFERFARSPLPLPHPLGKPHLRPQLPIGRAGPPAGRTLPELV